MKTRFLLAVFFIMLPTLACDMLNSQTMLSDQVGIPDSNFAIQPLATYQVRELGSGLYIYKSLVGVGAKQPKFRIIGHRFGENESREEWIQEKLTGSDLNETEAITINGISGFVATYQFDNSQEVAQIKLAVLATEDQGLLMNVTAQPAQAAEAEKMFDAMLESIVLIPRLSD